jgi:hypothetical protein
MDSELDLLRSIFGLVMALVITGGVIGYLRLLRSAESPKN